MRKEQLEALGFQQIKDGTWGQVISPVYLDAAVIVRAFTDKETAIVSMRIVQNDQPAELVIGTCANRAADLKHLLSWLKMNGADIGEHIVNKAIQRKKQSKTK